MDTEAVQARDAERTATGVTPAAPPFDVFCELFDPKSEGAFDAELDDAVRGLAAQRGGLSGFCNVAGATTRFRYGGGNFRESMMAEASGSINRQRLLVSGLAVAMGLHPATALAEVAGRLKEPGRKTLVAEASSPIVTRLRQMLSADVLACAEYFGAEHKSGDVVNGVMHQDLERTSFADSAVDVVLTADVMEHVPDALAAEREIARILRPRGVHVFTVPFLPYHEHDIVRAFRDSRGLTHHVAEPVYHGDPLRPEGSLLYRLFSHADLRRRYDAVNCDFTTYRLWSKSLGIVGNDCFAMVARKRS